MNTVFSISAKSNLYKNYEPQKFFDFIKGNGVKRIIDIRRGGYSRYSGCFQDKKFALLCENEGIGYVKEWDLAPQRELFKRCDAEKWDMVRYAYEYLADERIVNKLKSYSLDELDGSAFFCAENELYNCHRWICVEAVKVRFNELKVVHLGITHYKNGNERKAIPMDIESVARTYIQSIFC